MKISLMGSIASGKGTQGEKLAAYLGIPAFSVGQVLREVAPSNPHYAVIQDKLAKGIQVDAEITSALLKDAVDKLASDQGYIIDGWAREITQLDHFNPFDIVLFLRISEEEALKRIVNRRTCSKCGAVYNLVSVPPKVTGVCDVCGGELVQRNDETEAPTRTRLEIFNKDTLPVVEFFRKEGKLIEINGEQSPEAVFQEILAKLPHK